MSLSEFYKKNKTLIIVIGVLLFIGLVTFLIWYFMTGQKFKKPVDGAVTSPFGDRIHPITKKAQFHNGVDFGSKLGSPIHAPMDGKVLKVYENSIGGKQLILLHHDGYTTGYAHMDGYTVKEGDQIKQGDVIGYVGKTGAATGAHLHFTFKKGDQYLNAVDYFDKIV